jgi:5-methylcytosine-specific restriction endonuclease McrA
MKKIGYKPLLNKKQRDKIKNRIKNLNIDISHFKYSFPKELKKYLIKDGQPCFNHIKKRLYEEKILEEKCVGCSIGNIYNNKPITLQLDHINGINTDNRIENLRILCPNCHSQTATWGTRNIKYQAKNNVL